VARVLCFDPDAERAGRLAGLFGEAGHECLRPACLDEALGALSSAAGLDAVVVCLEMPPDDVVCLCTILADRDALGGAVRVLYGSCPSTSGAVGAGGAVGLLPADIYVEELEDVAHLVRAVEWLLDAD
jgi:hypothetical protein